MTVTNVVISGVGGQGTILGPIDSSIVNVILPTITGAFSASLATAQWVPMTYLLTIGSLVLFFGRLGDIWGYRKVFLSGLLAFTVTSWRWFLNWAMTSTRCWGIR